jgi:HEPN domain-containing protein
MHYLYHGGGADITEIGEPLVSDGEWQTTKVAASRLLSARRQTAAANLLTRVPFAWVGADNFFGDEFSVLHAVVPVEQYVALQEAKLNKTIEHPFEAIAKTISEISPSRPFVRFVVATLDTEDDSALSVAPPSPKITSESVDSALADAELLARSRGPSSAVDRAHTAVHAYLRAALARTGQVPAPRSSATELIKQLRERDPRLRALVDGGEEAKRIVMALTSIIDAAGTLRNNSSAAHPSASILQRPEAMLVINAAKSLIHYLDAKLDDAT